VAREERFQAEPERLDLLELLDAERRNARAPPRQADDEALALEATERMPDGCQADLEASGQLLQPQPGVRCEPQAADVLAERAIDDVLGGGDLGRRKEDDRLIFDS
jgi:hypothetical protein